MVAPVLAYHASTRSISASVAWPAESRSIDTKSPAATWLDLADRCFSDSNPYISPNAGRESRGIVNR